MLDKKIDLVFDTKLTRNLYNNVKIKFIEKKKVFFVISAVAIIVSVGSLAVKRNNFV